MDHSKLRRLAWAAAGGLGATLALGACSLSLTSAGPAVNAPAPAATAGNSIPIQAPPVSGSATALDAARVAAAILPTTAEIIVQTRGGTALGTGFVVAHGSGVSYLLTNNHVVEGARSVQVLMNDGRHWKADVKGTDPLEDLAVVSVPDATLALAPFGDSTRAQVGQPVVAIGNPEGNQGSVTMGVVSALHRTLTNVGGGAGSQGENLPDVIQTDAAINPGNSGGPLVDAAGLVIGVNTAGDTSATGIGFAIPSSIARRIADDLIAGRPAGHPYVGLCTLDLADALANPSSAAIEGYGAVVQGTVPGGPGATAGIRTGDMIETVGGTDLNNGNTLGGVLQLHEPGESLPVTVLRNGAKVGLSVKLGDFPANPPRCQ